MRTKAGGGGSTPIHAKNTGFAVDPLLQDAIDQFDLFSYLDEVGVEYQLEGKNIGRNFIGIQPCPGCGDTRFHFGIHKEHKSGHCWLCPYKTSLVGLVAHYSRLSWKAAKSVILETLHDHTVDNVDQVRRIINYTPPRIDAKPAKLVDMPPSARITPEIIAKMPNLQKFMKKRHLHIWHFDWYQIRIGVRGQVQGCLILPVYLNNMLVAYQTRPLTFKQYITHGDMSHFLWGEDQIDPSLPLILVEGYLDLIRIHAFIKGQKLPFCVTSPLTKKISGEQKNKLAYINPKVIISLLDYDAWTEYLALKDDLPVDVDYHILPRGQDPNSLSNLELHTLFAQLQRESSHD